MNMKKILSAVLALVLMLSCAALAEQTDADRIAELEAQVAELTAQLEEAQATIKEYEDANYVVTFDGGYVTVDECEDEYEYIESMYTSYGYSLDGYEDYVRESIAQSLAEQAVLKVMAEKLGYAEIEESVMTAYEEEAQLSYENNVTAYQSYFTEDGMTEEEIRQATEEYLASAGYTYEDILADMVDTHVQSALYDSVTGDVTVSEEEIQAAYDEAVATDEAAYAEDPYTYEYTQAQGGTIYWNPEGYRAVKHVLVKFSDEQATNYTEISDIIADLEAQIAAATAEPAETEAAAGETAETAVEETAEPVDVAALEIELATAKAELEALYADLLPTAEEVVSRFENGEDFDALMAEYGEDPGMQQEPGMSQGYYVCAEQGAWEAAFNDGAMAIENVGEISDLVYGSNGIHIIYYLADVTPGAVPLEELHETVESNALSDKIAQVYSDQVAAWMTELNVEYHMERFD